jgi:hypothetical protein
MSRFRVVVGLVTVKAELNGPSAHSRNAWRLSTLELYKLETLVTPKSLPPPVLKKESFETKISGTEGDLMVFRAEEFGSSS